MVGGNFSSMRHSRNHCYFVGNLLTTPFTKYCIVSNSGLFSTPAGIVEPSCLALGMIGTVIGFLLMLGTAFSDLDVTSSEALQAALASMAVGMSTALYTTLIGLVCSLIIKVQLMNLEVALEE